MDINLDDWADYQRSYGALTYIKNTMTSNKNAPRLLKIGVLNMIEKGGFVKEDLPIAKMAVENMS